MQRLFNLWTSTTTAAEWGRVAALLALACLLITSAGCPEKKAKPGTPTPSPEVGKLAEGMGKPLDTIKTESRAAVKKAPEVAPHTDAIDAAASDLTTIQAQLRAAQTTIAANDKTYRALEAALTKERDESQAKAEKLGKELAKAREDKNSALSKILWALVGLGVVAAPVLLFMAKSGPMALTAAGIAGMAIVAEVFLGVVHEYRLPIAIGLGLALAGVVLYAVFGLGTTAEKAVTFSEKIKDITDPEEIKRRGREIVGKNAFVDKVREKVATPKGPSLWARFVAWLRSLRDPTP